MSKPFTKEQRLARIDALKEAADYCMEEAVICFRAGHDEAARRFKAASHHFEANAALERKHMERPS